jgi:hypothetical protein
MESGVIHVKRKYFKGNTLEIYCVKKVLEVLLHLRLFIYLWMVNVCPSSRLENTK